MAKEEETEKVAQDDKYAEFSILLYIQDAQDPPRMYLTITFELNWIKILQYFLSFEKKTISEEEIDRFCL